MNTKAATKLIGGDVTVIMKRLTVLSLSLVSALTFIIGTPASASESESSSSGATKYHSSIKWPGNQQLPTFSTPKHLDVVNVYKESGDIKLLLTSLQGIVNRHNTRVYVQQNEVDPWVKDLNIPYTRHNDPMKLFKDYMKEIKGVIIYDPAVPDSINVASTLAGLKDGVVASPELAKTLTAAPYRLKVLDDLQGKFKDRMDAYTWQYEHLWSQTTKRMLVGLSPDTSIPIPPGLPESFQMVLEEKNQVRDGSNRDTYDLDLTPFLGKEAVYLRMEDAFPQDGWGPAVHEISVKADGEEIIRFKTGTTEEEKYLYDRHGSKVLPDSDHRFADHNNYFVYEFAPPANTKQLTVSIEMWNQFKVFAGNVRPLSSEQREPYGYLRDYAIANKAMIFWLSTSVPEQKALFEKILTDVKPGTPYLGWFDNDFEGEAAGIDITSRHSVYVVPSDWFHNMTVFAGTKPKPIKPAKTDVPKLNNKIYVTFTFGEGDNLQYDLNHLRSLWDDPARGKVPINWTFSPLLYDAGPAILNYYSSTATSNDLLVAGPSGVGYFSPHAWPEKSFQTFLKDTYPYMKKTNMSYPFVLNREVEKDLPLSASKANAYANILKVPGLFLGGGYKKGVEIVNGNLPVSMLNGIGTVQDGKDLLSEFKSGWDGKSPTFISVGINAWGMRPSDVLAIAESLGPEYEVVKADQYFALVREAYNLPKNP